MKIRTDFVTNSSSSSFILLQEVPEEIKKENYKKFDSFEFFLNWYLEYSGENYYNKDLEKFCKMLDLSVEQKYLVKLGYVGANDYYFLEIMNKVYPYLSVEGNSVSVFESVDNNYRLHEFLCELSSESGIRISE